MIEPYYQTDLGKLYCGDAVDIMRRLPEALVDLTVTSPPYDNLREYKGYVFDSEGIANQLYRVTKQGGVVVWVVADETIDGSETGTSFRQALFFKSIGFNIHDTMIYEAKGTGAKGSCYSYWQAFEYMFVFSKGPPKTVNRIRDRKNKTYNMLSRAGRYRENGNDEKPHKTIDIGIRNNIWRYSVGFMDKSDKTPHPAPFPEKLANDHIISWSNEGDMVFDPMVGSGTVPKMCEKLDRKWIACDMSQEYCDIAKDRIEKEAQQLKLFRHRGE